MMARGRSSERGAALLVVMVAVAVLTALAVNLAYDARVSLQISANARDELRATYLAKSGVSLSRLVLSFQQQVDAAMPTAQGMPGMPRPLIWRLIPVGSDLAANLFPGEGAAVASRPTREAARPTVETAALSTAEAPAAPARPAPPREGFDAQIDDEGRKVNAQLDGIGVNLGAQVQALYQLICDPKWDPLFDREDANGMRVSRQDLLVYLHDWFDPDETTSSLAASFPPGGCAIVVPQNPFEQGGVGDENAPYQRGPDRYRAKNARIDSLDELYMVAGIGDAFMGAFGDALTVYLPKSAQRNVNETDRDMLVFNARLIANPPNNPALDDPKFGELLQKQVFLRTAGGLLAMTPAVFGEIVASLGVPVDQTKVASTNTNAPFTDRPTVSVFRIRADGRAGAVAKTLDVVVRFDGTQGTQGPQVIQGQNATPTLGRVVHWREE